MENLKRQLAEQALLTDDVTETLEMLYIQNKLEPQKHINPLTNKVFHGKNVWVLELAYIMNDYKSCEWSTFAQYNANKTSVKKGQKGTYLTLAVFNKQKDEKGEEKEVLQFFKGYTVFNKEQTGENAKEIKKETKKPEVNKQLNLWLNKGIEAVA